MPKGIQNSCTGLPDLIEEVWEIHVLLQWSLEAERETLGHLKQCFAGVQATKVRPQAIQATTPGSTSVYTEIGTCIQSAGTVLLTLWLFGS